MKQIIRLSDGADYADFVDVEPDRLVSMCCNEDEYEYLYSTAGVCFKYLSSHFNFVKQTVSSVKDDKINEELRVIIKKAQDVFKNCKEYELCLRKKEN